MIASQIIILASALIALSSTIAGSTCAFFCSTRGRTSVAVLKDKKHTLEILIHDLEQKLVAGAAVFMPDPSPWIEKAKTFLTGLNVAYLEERLDAKCINGLLPNCYAQKRAQTATEDTYPELDGLIEEGQRLLRELKVRGFRQLHEVAFVGNCRIEAKEELWRLVSTDSTLPTVCIHIHGAFGVGKTAIAISIHNRALEDTALFDHVVWVTVEYGGVWHVQEDIARSLVIDMSDIPKTNDLERRAQRLKAALLSKMKFLLVLDSMWEAHSLKDIGIPEEKAGCKLIVTSRISTVCNKIKARKLFELKPLPRDEAFELFKYETVPANLSSLHAETLKRTEGAVAELDGLPLAINKLAQTLNEIQEDNPAALNSKWVKKLARADLATTPINRDHDPFDGFKYSYNNLKEETRSCFLFCALYPKDHVIDSNELIEYWMWEGLLGDIETLENTTSKGKDTLKELKSAHLLESVAREGGDHDKVKMLNLVRSMAIDITVKSGNMVFIRSGGSLSHLPLGDEWPPEVTRASFIRNQISDLRLRNGPKCNRLSTLLLQDNPLNLECSDHFFKNMRDLRVLDLSRTQISTLPKSLSNLTKLRALVLRACSNLKTLPSLSKLRELIVLDLSSTLVDHCPEGIQNMTKLRRIDLSEARLVSFPANILDKLIQLEELLMLSTHGSGAGHVWGSKVLDEQWEGACIEELVGLPQLAVLELNFLDSKVFDMYVTEATNTTRVPQRFLFCVREVQSSEYVRHNSVTISGSPTSESELNVASLLKLGNLNVLDLSNLSSIPYLFTVEIMGSLTKLRELHVRSCEETFEVVLQRAAKDTISLPELKKMVLFDLPRLESVCCGEVLHCPNMRSIDVWRCENFRLPMIKTASSSIANLNLPMKIQIRGERRWLNRLKLDNPASSYPLFQASPQSNSNSNFILVEAPLPPEFTSPARLHRRMLQGVIPCSNDNNNNNIIANVLQSKVVFGVYFLLFLCGAKLIPAQSSWIETINLSITGYNVTTGAGLLVKVGVILPILTALFVGLGLYRLPLI